jgi:hypothetical protein
VSPIGRIPFQNTGMANRDKSQLKTDLARHERLKAFGDIDIATPRSPEINACKDAELATIEALLDGAKNFAIDASNEVRSRSTILSSKKQDNVAFDFATSLSSDVSFLLLSKAQRELSPVLADHLCFAGRLIECALPHARGVDSTPSAIGLAYFNKLALTRVVPYANVAFVGIPYSSLTRTRDLLAIPHEAGHYVYWSKTIDEHRGVARPQSTFNKVAAALKGKVSDWLYDWREEVFVDVYTAFVGGPAAAIAFQDHLLDSTAFSFDKHDGEHPIPLVRPLIHSAALGALFAIHGKSWQTHLEARWINLVKSHRLLETTSAVAPPNITLGPSGGFDVSQITVAVGEIANILSGIKFPDCGVWDAVVASVPACTNDEQYLVSWEASVNNKKASLLATPTKPALAMHGFAKEYDDLKKEIWPDLPAGNANRETSILRNLGGWKDGPHPPGDSGP